MVVCFGQMLPEVLKQSHFLNVIGIVSGLVLLPLNNHYR